MTTAEVVAVTILGVCTVTVIVLGAYTVADWRRMSQPTVSTDANDGAWHTVWLEGNWRWITRKMTTEQREHAAAAVERYSAAQGDPDDEPINVRWWLT